jgi:hypothetical protein
MPLRPARPPSRHIACRPERDVDHTSRRHRERTSVFGGAVTVRGGLPALPGTSGSMCVLLRGPKA